MMKSSSAIRTVVVTHSIQPPEGSTTICTDELGPVIPRTFAPAPSWSSNGHRMKAPLEDQLGAGMTKSGFMERCASAMGRKSRAVQLRAIPRTLSSSSRTSKPTIQPGMFSSSRTISRVITAWKPALGWRTTHASNMFSFPKVPVGSICRRAGWVLWAPLPPRCSGWPELCQC